MYTVPVDADPSDVVMIPNVTTGVSTVVKSLVKTFKPGDTIYTLNVAYGELTCYFNIFCKCK